MILALECSSDVASVAVLKNENLLCESMVATGLFHSQTLMVMLNNMLQQSQLKLSEVELVAVSKGPGSFTGLRIGASAAKGLALGFGVECVGVSTLKGLAANLMGLNVIVCAVMDARNDFVYYGLFSVTGKNIVSLENESVILVNDLEKILQKIERNRQIVLIGDAAKKCYLRFSDGMLNLMLASDALGKARASSVGLCAAADFKGGVENHNFRLNYLRPSQAQRQLEEKQFNEL